MKACNSIKKRLQPGAFLWILQINLRTPFFTEQLQWLFLRFSSCFQTNPEQKPQRLSADKKYLLPRKSAPQWEIYRRKVIAEFFYPFKLFSPKFSMTKWFCCVICFVKVFLLLFFSLKQFSDYFYHKQICFIVHTLNEMLWFLHFHYWDYCWKYEFFTDVKIE